MANLVKLRQPLGITFIDESEIDAGTLKVEFFSKVLEVARKYRVYTLVCYVQVFWRKTTKI